MSILCARESFKHNLAAAAANLPALHEKNFALNYNSFQTQTPTGASKVAAKQLMIRQ